MTLKYVVREHFQVATFVTMLNIIVLKLFKKITETLVYFGTMLNMTVPKLLLFQQWYVWHFGTMLNMTVSKPRNMLFIKIIVFHKMLKTLLYD